MCLGASRQPLRLPLLSSRLLASDAARATYALAWAKSGGCEGQITIIETACDRCQREGEQHAS